MIRFRHFAHAIAAGFVAGTALTSAAQALQPEAEAISMDLSTGRPMVELMVNEEGPYPFVFDTGAGVFTVHPQLVETLGLEISGQGQISSPGGQAFPVDLVNLETVSLGHAQVGDIEARVVDMGLPVEVGGYGVLGPVQFRAFDRVAFDFENQRIEVGGSFNKPDDVAWQAFGDDAPLLDIMLTVGDARIPAHIDTGNPGGLMLPRDIADQLPLDAPLQVVGQARMVDGTMDIYGAPISQSFQAGDASIPVSNVLFFERAMANIGSGALRGLQLEIDWAHERYALWGEAQPAQPQRRG